MKKIFAVIAAVLIVGTVAACQKKEDAKHTDATAAQPTTDSQVEPPHKGKVKSVINSVENYTYVEFEDNGRSYWAAGPKVNGIAVGDAVSLSSGIVMKNFPSKKLNRVFPEILFVGSISKGDLPVSAPAQSGGMDHGKMSMQPTASPQQPDATAGSEAVIAKDIPRAEYTIADLVAKKDSLKSKTVSVNGKVIKVNPNIMGRNWVHIADGSGDHQRDLLVTTKADVNVGDIVTAKGVLSVDKDFSAGYKYDLVIDGADVVKIK